MRLKNIKKIFVIVFLLTVTGSIQAKEPHLEHHAPITRQLKSTHTYLHDQGRECFKKADLTVTGSVWCALQFTTKDHDNTRVSYYYSSPSIRAGMVTSYSTLDELGSIVGGMIAYDGAKFSLSRSGQMSRMRYMTEISAYDYRWVRDENGYPELITDYLPDVYKAVTERGYYALKDAKGNYWSAYKLYTGDKSKWYVGSKVKNYWLRCKPTDNFSREYGCYGELIEYKYKTRNGIKYFYFEKNNNRTIFPISGKPLLLTKKITGRLFPR